MDNLRRTGTVALGLLSVSLASCSVREIGSEIGFGATGASGSAGTGERPGASGTSNPTASGTSNPMEPVPPGKVCVETCTADADCRVLGGDEAHVCEQGRCIPGPPCVEDGDCVTSLNNWQLPCTSSQQCLQLGGGNVCILVPEGGGRCTIETAGLSCAALGRAELTVLSIEGGPVDVCVVPYPQCEPQGTCVRGCTVNNDCNDPAFPACNETTGRCGCLIDTHCIALADPSRVACRPDGACGCATDEGCRIRDAGDVCVAGQCQCRAETVCAPPRYEGTVVRCEPPA